MIKHMLMGLCGAIVGIAVAVAENQAFLAPLVGVQTVLILLVIDDAVSHSKKAA